MTLHERATAALIRARAAGMTRPPATPQPAPRLVPRLTRLISAGCEQQ
jgi:hypothetical protein